MISAHNTLCAIDFARNAHPLARRLAVMEYGTAFCRTTDILCVDYRKKEYTVRKGKWKWFQSGSIPFDACGEVVLEYGYRDGGNNKTSAAIRIPGPLSRADFSLLLGTLSAGKNWEFIPHQVGLRDLQEDVAGIPDFSEDGQDHVWHNLIELAWIQAGGEHFWEDAQKVEWQTFKAALVARSQSGYDEKAAIAHLEKQYQQESESTSEGWNIDLAG